MLAGHLKVLGGPHVARGTDVAHGPDVICNERLVNLAPAMGDL